MVWIYRRLVWSKIWHFCRDCHYWPAEHYVEATIPPDPEGLCRICELKETWDKCDRGSETRGK